MTQDVQQSDSDQVQSGNPLKRAIRWLSSGWEGVPSTIAFVLWWLVAALWIMEMIAPLYGKNWITWIAVFFLSFMYMAALLGLGVILLDRSPNRTSPRPEIMKADGSLQLDYAWLIGTDRRELESAWFISGLAIVVSLPGLLLSILLRWGSAIVALVIRFRNDLWSIDTTTWPTFDFSGIMWVFLAFLFGGCVIRGLLRIELWFTRMDRYADAFWETRPKE